MFASAPCRPAASYKDVVFFGFNAVLYGGGDLYALSQSDAIPELAVRRVPGMLEANQKGMKELGNYGLKAYAWLNTRQKFPKDDPVFKAHPEIRGSLTWAADGEYTLCTSHPLVRRYLEGKHAGHVQIAARVAGRRAHHRRRRVLSLPHAAVRRGERTHELRALRAARRGSGRRRFVQRSGRGRAQRAARCRSRALAVFGRTRVGGRFRR